MKSCQVARLLAYVTGLVNQELLLQVEYLVAENRILRAHAPARLRLSNEQRSTLAEIGKRLGRKGLAKVALIAEPETILSWFRKLVAQKFDGSKCRSYPGRPRIDDDVEAFDSGILRISLTEFDKVAADASYQLRYQMFDGADGLGGAPTSPLRSALVSFGGVMIVNGVVSMVVIYVLWSLKII